jgi:uncharacterized protein (DUF302 family)
MTPIATTVPLSMADAEAAIRAALQAQGFGVLTEIDVASVLKAKIDVDRAPLKILGACNPHLANRAIGIDVNVALLLPCNVVLEQVEDGVRVSAIDPTALMQDPAFADLAAEATAKLQAAIDALG